MPKPPAQEPTAEGEWRAMGDTRVGYFPAGRYIEDTAMTTEEVADLLSRKQSQINAQARRIKTLEAKAVMCPLIEEKARDENYILFVCGCGAEGHTRELCPFYDALTAQQKEDDS